MTFVFNTPFVYDGTSNLFVDYSFNNSSYTSGGACRCSTTSATRAIYYYTDNGYGAPLTWSGSSNPAPTTSTSLPNVQLGFAGRTVPIRPAMSGNFTAGTWTGSISVPFAGAGLKLQASDATGHTGTSNAFAVNTVPPPSNGTTIFSEDFESGSLNPSYWASTGTGTFRTQVTSANNPHGGSYHLTMDSSADNVYERNELTLTLDLKNRTGVKLSFWVNTFGDEIDGPPSSPFIGGADFDGVAISADGNTWWEVQSLRSLTGVYQQFTVDLDAAIAAHGLSYNSAFKIRFNHYDNYSISTDGFGFDDIVVTGDLLHRGRGSTHWHSHSPGCAGKSCRRVAFIQRSC